MFWVVYILFERLELHFDSIETFIGYQEPGCPTWKAKPLTRDHKPESASEMSRIEQCGGKVVSKSG